MLRDEGVLGAGGVRAHGPLSPRVPPRAPRQHTAAWSLHPPAGDGSENRERPAGTVAARQERTPSGASDRSDGRARTGKTSERRLGPNTRGGASEKAGRRSPRSVPLIPASLVGWGSPHPELGSLGDPRLRAAHTEDGSQHEAVSPYAMQEEPLERPGEGPLGSRRQAARCFCWWPGPQRKGPWEQDVTASSSGTKQI